MEQKGQWNYFNLPNHNPKWLNRRSQRRSFNRVEFTACWKRYGVPKPRIVESNQVQLHFDSKTGNMEANTLEEPGAIIPHAWTCAGGGRVTGISTVTKLPDQTISKKE